MIHGEAVLVLGYVCVWGGGANIMYNFDDMYQFNIQHIAIVSRGYNAA